jgi:hypothetical protein
MASLKAGRLGVALSDHQGENGGQSMKCAGVVLTLIVLSGVVLEGCEQEQPTAATGWSADALQIAEQLAGKVRAAGMACDGFEPSPVGSFDADYQRKLPLAAAVATCSTDDEEDLTFEVFKDAKLAREFLEAKQKLLCARAAAMQLTGFPGFPYVDGGAWIVEPDEKATAERLAPVLGGEAKVAGCSKN